jgi:hypothetical protein
MGRPKSTVERVCCVEGCNEKLVARGCCKFHYNESYDWKASHRLKWRQQLEALVASLNYDESTKRKLLGETL